MTFDQELQHAKAMVLYSVLTGDSPKDAKSFWDLSSELDAGLMMVDNFLPLPGELREAIDTWIKQGGIIESFKGYDTHGHFEFE